MLTDINRINNTKKTSSVSTSVFSTLCTNTSHNKLKHGLKEIRDFLFKYKEMKDTDFSKYSATLVNNTKNRSILFDKSPLKLSINYLLQSWPKYFRQTLFFL